MQGCGERHMNHHHVLCSGLSWVPVKGYRAAEDTGVGHSPGPGLRVQERPCRKECWQK